MHTELRYEIISGKYLQIQANCPSLNQWPCANARLEPGPMALIASTLPTKPPIPLCGEKSHNCFLSNLNSLPALCVVLSAASNHQLPTLFCFYDSRNARGVNFHCRIRDKAVVDTPSILRTTPEIPFVRNSIVVCTVDSMSHLREKALSPSVVIGNVSSVGWLRPAAGGRAIAVSAAVQ